MANTGFTVNAHRRDPYKPFKFKVLMDNRVVLGVSKVGALKRTTEVVKYRSGGDDSHDSKSPGRTSYDGVTMERGVTHDREFERWANSVHDFRGDALMDLAGYKKELTVEVMNEKGQVAFRYFLHGCWVSEYTAFPDLDANSNAIAIEHIKVEIEGFTRDLATNEPNEAG
ncbi:MAG TPA: phage tail protein [Fibrobacteria bacterium]|nr:phage tail protein [Fibrobacteria bacterium]